MGVRLEGIAKRFGPVVAVDDLTLQVREGELLAVVGPSGCGKTTLLRTIAGLERQERGRVLIAGTDVSSLPPERRGVGVVFQHFALFPTMNVAQNIAYGLKQKKTPRAERERRVAELLSLVGLEGLGGRRPWQLSAGQQQRVALARALAPRPKTLLLDEPFSALDASMRERLRDEIKRIQRHFGITTILVTHDQEDALGVADRVAVMNEGRLEQVGEPWEIYASPQTLFVARFIGRINVLPAVARPHGLDLGLLGSVPYEAMEGPIVPGRSAGSSSHQSGEKRPPLGRISVLVRPEAVLIGDVSNEPGLRIVASVERVRFLGERSWVELRVGKGSDGSDADAVLLWATVMSRDAGHLSRRIGREVPVTIPYTSLRWLPVEPPGDVSS